MRYILVFSVFVFSYSLTDAQTRKPTWIWYPGDYEIWLGNKMQNLRTERNAFVPPFWRVYNHHPLVNFTYDVDLNEEEVILISVEGKYNVTVDGKYIQTSIDKVTIPKGKHNINLQVTREHSPPAVFVSGKTIASDDTWKVKIVRNNNPDNFPSNELPVYADSWDFNSPESFPSNYKLPTKEFAALDIKRTEKNVFVDFGKESFGYLKFVNLKGKGTLHLYYGESKEEAESLEYCETLDHIAINKETSGTFITDHSRAFRFVNIISEGDLKFDDIKLMYEYLPMEKKGSFISSDHLLNKIWNVSEYTLELTTREFFIDGIKRDRWIWSGDANQSYLMNYYSFYDLPVVRRTVRQLRGGEPVEAHINTILDYSFYWFMSIYEYYLYTGDDKLLKQMYPKMVSLMEYCLSRRNEDGFVEGLPGDWVFLDWAPISKEGELSAIQMLYCKSVETMALCASLVNDTPNAERYNKIAVEVRKKIFSVFWDKEKQVFIHSRKAGKLDNTITRYPNMFAMMFGYLNATQVESVKKNVLLNKEVLQITTPYMRFYELEALCAVGQQGYVKNEISSYWGGMLNEGATAFWEMYDPNEKGSTKYAMYGRPFGKSLCHAWGASPVYLLGKYYLGVRPLQPGYKEYIIEPNLGGLATIEGKVPTPEGMISVKATTKSMTIGTVKGKGILRIQSTTKPKTNSGQWVSIGKEVYELALNENQVYEIGYTSIKAK